MDPTVTRAVRYRSADGSLRIGRLEDDVIVDAGPAGRSGFIPSEDGWRQLARADGPRLAIADVTLVQPVVPSKVLCIGLNYRAHAVESGQPIPEKPIVFAKLPSALNDPEAPIVLPADEPWPDYEAEVAIVIGRRVRRADREQARGAIGGVTALNDVSARHAQLSPAAGGQWMLGKNYDGFAPLGPAIARADRLDLANLDVACRLSGEEVQRSNTRDLIFGCEALVSQISSVMTLEPGDVIATGTPGGVGHASTPPRYLRPGDVVEVEVTAVGTLRNRVVAEDDSSVR